MKFTDRFETPEQFAAFVETNYEDVSRKYSWITGGMNGGNCWGDSANWRVEAETEPEIEGLDELIMDLDPTFSFMQYRLLQKEDFVDRGSGHDNEYYGNFTTYDTKKVNLDKLYRAFAKILG